ncbi:MAG: hypothetical protein OZ929_11260 [Bryobacterales bacterium]|nr:hypothetical protein [Bryobacterales bacterium]
METIYKLQPNRAIHLQGFNDFGAAAALHSTSETGLTVSGVFRDAADFCVLVLWDRDDFFGHPRFSYLPDSDFTGITLTFDLAYQNLQPIDSPKFATIDWPFLNCLATSGQTIQLRLFDRATQVGGTYTKASGTFTLNDAGMQAFDRVTLWYQNLAFDYIVPGKLWTEFPFYAQGQGFTHSVTVAGRTYNHTEGPGESSADVASAIVAAVTADPDVTPSIGSAGYMVKVTRKLDTGVTTNISSIWGGSDTIWQVKPATVLRSIRDQINNTNWSGLGVLIPLSATVSGNQISITAERPGVDGNMVRLYELRKNGNLYFSPGVLHLSGGSSDATWRVAIDFSAEGITDIQKLWLTFAPRLMDSEAYEAEEWSATFSNWSVSDPQGKRTLKVAGPLSVRIEENDSWVKYLGYWEWAPDQFWSQGRAVRAAQSNSKAIVETHCSGTHDVYLGTRLDFDCGIVEARLDGGAPVQLDCYEPAARARQVRRRIFSNVPPGNHSVEVRLTGTKNTDSQGFYHYFDFLECAVLSDVPDAPEVRTDVGVACDYGTDHTYKLSPQRLVWAIQKLGLVGEIDHYVSVYWWNQRRRSGGSFPSATVTFGGTWAGGDEAFLNLSGTLLGKSVFPADTPETIASHFAYFINDTLVGVWAEADGGQLTITVRSPAPAYSYALSETHSSAAGTVNMTGSLTGGVMGEWVLDETIVPVLNRAARDWHADYFAELVAKGMTCVTAFSQELVLPPDDPPTAVWVQRYPDGDPVQTATGFGNKFSSHCAFGPPFRNYIKQGYAEVATLMEAAGLEARLQFGEVLWWFFPNDSGMAFYDAYTTAAFQSAQGRPLQLFVTPNDDPSVNDHVDADFLRQAVRDHVAAIRSHVLASHPSAKFEILWPLDVNDPDTRQLNRYINLPTEWTSKPTSGFDTFMIEGFQYAGLDRNIDKVRAMAAYPFEVLTWPRNDCRYLMGHFNSGWPWQRDYLAAQRARTPLVKLWAYDHLCLFSRPLPLPLPPRRQRH